MNEGITIIICTYNGAERLPQTIAHIAKLDVLNHISWEVIVADNNSTDNSSAVASFEWNKHPLDDIAFTIINEPEPGKIYALQHAINKAAYEYLIICDDDNWLAPDYLNKAHQLLRSMPEIGAFGGRGVAVTDGTPLPPWFKSYQAAYAVGPQAEKTGILKPKTFLWGAGLATKRSFYKKMYEKYPSFLLGNKSILSAEDTEYCLRLLLKGYKLYYDSDLIFQHYIPGFKLNEAFRDEKLLKGFDNAHIILRKYYAALRVYLKAKDNYLMWFLLLLIAPVNYIFSFSEKRAEKAKNTLYHLLPFGIKGDPISKRIKSFISGS